MSKNGQLIDKQMVEKLPLKITLLAVAMVIAWWLWPSASGTAPADSQSAENRSAANQLVSSIQPISEADASDTAQIEKPGKSAQVELLPVVKIDQKLISEFGEINQLIESERSELAIPKLNNLIAEYPQVIEPYINLASLYAEAGQFERAKQILSQAMTANPNTAILYTSVQKVYAAQAAKAYKLALNEQDVAPQALRLPRISSLDTSVVKDDTVARLQRQLNMLESQNKRLIGDYDSLKNDSALAVDSSARDQQLLLEKNTSLAALSSEVADSQNTIQELKDSHQSEVAALQEQLAAQTQLASAASEREQVLLASARQQTEARNLEARERERLAKETADQQARDRLAKQAADQKAQEAADLAAQQQAIFDKAQLASEKRDIEIAKQQAASAVQQRNSAVITLVKKWAENWSAQNVSGYVASYADDYTPPGRNISRTQWLQQRQVRLTNKKFIDVDVSAFSVRDLGGQLEVTFTQHYRSNTVDDRIRKRLVFQKIGDDVSAAKIVNELVVSG